MRIIAAILVAAALLLGLSAVTLLTPDLPERGLQQDIQRLSAQASNSELQARMESELLQSQTLRRSESARLFVCSALLLLLALGTIRHTARDRCASPPFTWTAFTITFRPMAVRVSRLPGSVFTHAQRVANARAALRPTLERLFGSKG